MSVNIPNYLLCKILDKDEELYEIADKISYFKPSKELNGYAEMFIERACKVINNFFHKDFNPPKLKFLDYNSSDFYRPETNTIHINQGCINIPDLLHEFRHFLQCQFKEFAYFKGNQAPLPSPFYHFQLHEINAYNFQHRLEFDCDRDKLGEATEIFEDFQHLIKIGAFNPKAFKIEHEYYKDYNVLFDQMDMDIVELKSEFPNSKITEFEQFFNGQNIKVAHYKTNKNFFNLHFTIDNHKYEANFEIKDKQCIIYGINICEDIRICQKEEYKKACDLVFDFANNVSKIYDVNEMDINPYSLNIHRKHFKNIIDDFKSNQVGIDDNLKFNHIPNPTPKENIIKELVVELNFVQEKDNEVFIEQEKILNDSCVLETDILENNLDIYNEER